MKKLFSCTTSYSTAKFIAIVKVYVLFFLGLARRLEREYTVSSGNMHAVTVAMLDTGSHVKDVVASIHIFVSTMGDFAGTMQVDTVSVRASYPPCGLSQHLHCMLPLIWGLV